MENIKNIFFSKIFFLFLTKKRNHLFPPKLKKKSFEKIGALYFMHIAKIRAPRRLNFTLIEYLPICYGLFIQPKHNSLSLRIRGRFSDIFQIKLLVM